MAISRMSVAVSRSPISTHQVAMYRGKPLFRHRCLLQWGHNSLQFNSAVSLQTRTHIQCRMGQGTLRFHHPHRYRVGHSQTVHHTIMQEFAHPCRTLVDNFKGTGRKPRAKVFGRSKTERASLVSRANHKPRNHSQGQGP